MVERVEQTPKPEERFQSLKQDIISNLKARGAVLNTPFKQVGYELIKIVDNQEEDDSYEALYLAVDGQWVPRLVGNVSFDIDGSFDNGVSEYARLVDPQAKAIDRNFKDETEEDFEIGSQRREKELREYVEGNRELLAQGLLNTMENRLQELKSEEYPYPKREVVSEPPKITSEDKDFIGSELRLTPKERLRRIFSEPPSSIEEILARPEEEPVDPIKHENLKTQMEEVLASLTDLERQVLQLRFGLKDGRSRTQVEVGREIGSSRWIVGRIQRKALNKLRHPSHPHTPKIF